MSVLPNDRYEKITAVAGQTVFNYDWDVPSAYPGQVKVIWYVLATQTKTLLTYGVDYTVDVANKRVTLTNATAAGDTIVLYSGTPEARETDFTGSTVNVAAANEAIDNLTWQTQQLARDVKRCVRVDMVEGILPGELPSVDARKNKYASWDAQGNLTYDDPVTGILNDYMRKDANLSDVNDVATSRANLGLGDSATRNVGTTAGTVCAGDDARFLTQAQKDALTNGGNADAMHIHSGYVATAEKGAPDGVATLDANRKLPVAQLPNNAVISTTTSADSEIALYNGGSGTQIKRSNKLLPAGDIVGTTDAQTLTNKTIDADNNTVSNLEVDNLKAGVLSTDLSGATSDTEIPSSKATKDYADTKCATVHNLGEGVQIAHEGLNGGTAEIRSLIAKDGIQLVQNENDIYIYAIDEQMFPNFVKQGSGADWLVDVHVQNVNYRSFTGSNGITITQNADEIDTSLTNITAQGDMIVGDAGGEASTLAKGADDQVLRMDGDDPQWETLGTMADQNSDLVNITGGTIDSVAITGGTVSGLTAPMAIADGGTGQTTKQDAFDALSPLTTEGDLITYDGVNNVRLGLGNAGEVLKTNATEDGLEWGVGYVSPTTTQGDLIVRGAATDGRLGIGTAGQVLKVNAAGTDPEWATLGSMSTQNSTNVNITGGAIDSVAITGGTVSGLTAPLALADGGTGQTTKTAAFDGLSPLTTQGDILTHDGTNNVRLARGTAGKYLRVNAGGTDVEWGDGYVSPTTTQGDIIVRGAAADERLGIGTAGQVLKVNGTGDGLVWANDAGTALTTRGDLLTRDATDEVRLPIGTPGQVLQVNVGGTDPEWATLGSMSTQDSTNVNITGGTISGLTTPLAVASGGTGLNSLGTFGQAPLVNSAGTALEYTTVDSLKTFGDWALDLNTCTEPGSRFVQVGSTNKPAIASSNAATMVVRTQANNTYIHQTYYDLVSGNIVFTRSSTNSGTTWSDWIPVVANACFHINKTTAQATLAYGTVTTIQFNNALMDPFHGFDATTYSYTIPFEGYWFLYSQLMFNIGGSAGQTTSVGISVNGVSILSSIVGAPLTAGNQTNSCCGSASLNKGDVVSIVSYGYSNYNTLDTAGYGNYFGGFYLGFF